MSTLDLLLVTPPSRLQVYQGLGDELAAIEPPVWSGLIAEHVRRRGYSVAILDAEAERLDHAQCATRAAEADAVLTVFVVYGQQPSASTQCMPGAVNTARLFHHATDRPSLVMGTHASALPERTLEEGPFTYVAMGEGPVTVVGLLDHLKSGAPTLDAVPGLCYRDEAHGVFRNAMAGKIRDLDVELPRQAWDLLDMSSYRAHNWHCFDDLGSRGSYASLQTSLGCPYKCSFCCINAPFGGAGIRFWSPEAVLRQVDELVNVYGVRNIKIPDEMFLLNRNHVLGLCDGLIERGYDLNIWAYARVDTLQPVLLEKLRAAGIRWLAVGIESGSDHVRDGVVKGRFGNADIVEAVQRARDAGVYVCANYIFGLPDDTEASMRDTLDLATTLNTEWANFYCAMAYPGSALYGEARARGWALPDDPGGPGWIGYSQHAYDCMPLPTESLGAEQVLDFRDRAFDAYFGSAAYRTLVRETFSGEVERHIEAMCAHTLRRRHHDEPGWIAGLQAALARGEVARPTIPASVA